MALAAIAAAGTYFLTGKRGAKSRESIAAWTLKMKGEVLGKMKKLREVNKDSYYALVDEISERYGKVEKVSAEEIKIIRAELRGAWARISEEIKKQA